MWTKIGLSGGCHWCTEAVFQSLVGTRDIQQGWLASEKPNEWFAEGVLLEFDPAQLPLDVLLAAHLTTHQSQKNHSFRNKYRSAVYFFSASQEYQITNEIQKLSLEYETQFVTQILPYVDFRGSREQIQNYYKKDREKPFCTQYITPKLQKLRSSFRPYFREI